jgi:hypothetical protein
VRDGGIFEKADDVSEGVHLAEFVKEGGILGAVFDEAADVDVFDGGVGGFFRLEKSGKLVETRVGNFGHADMRGRVGGPGIQMCVSEDFEEAGFSDVREADDSGLHCGGIVAQRCRTSRRLGLAHGEEKRGKAEEEDGGSKLDGAGVKAVEFDAERVI